MIQAIADVARPALSLAFLAFCVAALEWLIRYDARELNARNTRRLFAGNRDPINRDPINRDPINRDPIDPFAALISESFRRKATEPEGRAPRAVPVLRENARSHSA